MICMAFLGAARFCSDATSLMTITLNRLPWEFPIVSNTSSGLARRATMSWKFSSAGFSVNAPHVTPATPISFSGNMMFEAGGHESQHKLLMLTWHLHLNIPLHSRQPNNPLWRSSTPQQNRHQQGLGLSPEKVDASSVALLGL